MPIPTKEITKGYRKKRYKRKSNGKPLEKLLALPLFILLASDYVKQC